MRVGRLVGGGQTGADQGALRAARDAGVVTGGWAEAAWLVEDLDWKGGRGYRPDVPAPWLADFGLRPCPTPGYPARRKANVAEAHAVVLFGNKDSHGSKGLARDCGQEHANIPLFHVAPGVRPSDFARWVAETMVPPGRTATLMAAGNRESSDPGIGGRVYAFMLAFFRLHGPG